MWYLSMLLCLLVEKRKRKRHNEFWFIFLCDIQLCMGKFRLSYKMDQSRNFFSKKKCPYGNIKYDDETFFFPSTFISDDRSEIKDRYKMYLISKENVTKKHFGSIAYLSRLKKYFIYGICERQYYWCFIFWPVSFFCVCVSLWSFFLSIFRISLHFPLPKQQLFRINPQPVLVSTVSW